MKTFFLALIFSGAVLPVQAQETLDTRSPGRAALLSLLLPGLGHRYVHHGSWRGSASYFTLAEAGLWLGILGVEWRQGQTTESYRTLAMSRAGADLQDKDRRFLVNLGQYMSSDAFREDHLRRRLWDQVNYVGTPDFQWTWLSEEDRQEYRRLREASDTWGRRRTVLISALVANRLLSALTSFLAARRQNDARPTVALSIRPPTPRMEYPSVHVMIGF